MNLSSENLDILSIKCHINNLPDEILEYILGLLRPYSDLKECMLVCKRWNRSALRECILLHYKPFIPITKHITIFFIYQLYLSLNFYLFLI